ncbi:hypothetical protein Cme02nite_70660 [Catellatospora methionotrophica]|uniref:DUF998 domain-containing protein n=1 Tax=Catellatospora methionotrophica TaxID=121620 RepID=A0A8J3LH18_9ACTN|nr:hypothetical protein [Catellatospora methionotrophica]GIG18734.1 hypothetical protein Cme02nite_70660 [Catellatospora methionotrophica]
MGSLARRGAVFAGLAAATALAAYALHDTNLDAWTWFNYDPQGFEQELWAWQTAAAFTATSGTLAAQLSALLFGRFLRRDGASPATALAAGLGLALTQLAVAVPMAMDRLNGKGMAIEMARHGHPFDPALWRQPVVVTAAVAAALSCLAWSLIGYGIGRRTGRVVHAVLAALAVSLYVLVLSAFFGTGPWWAPAVLAFALGLVASLLSRGASTRAAAATT